MKTKHRSPKTAPGSTLRARLLRTALENQAMIERGLQIEAEAGPPGVLLIAPPSRTPIVQPLPREVVLWIGESLGAVDRDLGGNPVLVLGSGGALLCGSAALTGQGGDA